MTVRCATAADAPVLAAIDAVCFSDPWSERLFEEALRHERYTFFLAVEQGMAVGYVGMVAVLAEADITNVAVLPSYRRRGFAGCLLRHLIGEAEQTGMESLHLEVRESNTAARRLYESLGFSVDGKRKRYYRMPTEDAILMTRHSTSVTHGGTTDGSENSKGE